MTVCSACQGKSCIVMVLILQMKERCIHCGIQFPVESLRKHVRACMLLRHSSDSEFEEEPKPKAPCIDISSEEEASEVKL